MITEQVYKTSGLDFEELEAQGAELLPDRVEMSKRKGYSRVFQQNNNLTIQVAASGIGDATNANWTSQSNSVS